MTKGDKVRVFPHGNNKAVAEGEITIISENQRSIAVSFDDVPPFAVWPAPTITIHSDYGVMFFGTREAINGVPWGPWVEMVNGGHYEIEEVSEVDEQTTDKS